VGKPVYTCPEVLALGTQEHGVEIAARMAVQNPGSCLTLVYTSGTTGPPKGVMLSHDNYIWTSKVFVEMIEFTGDNERIVSYLPLSHVAG
jgi:long-chain-fatty-acid--CoA ligase ACSBG